MSCACRAVLGFEVYNGSHFTQIINAPAAKNGIHIAQTGSAFHIARRGCMVRGVLVRVFKAFWELFHIAWLMNGVKALQA